MLFLLRILSALFVLQECLCKDMLRIVGAGKETDGRFSWVVRLAMQIGSGDAVCGGNAELICCGGLINQNWVLAPAHCSEATHVQLNTKLATREGKEKTLIYKRIVKTHVHPGYTFLDTARVHGNRGRLENDIALFKTEDIKMKQYGKLDSRDFRGLFGREVYFIGYGISKFKDKYKNQEEIDKEIKYGPLRYGIGLLGECTTARFHDTLIQQSLHFNFCIMRKCSDFSLMGSGDSGGPVVLDDKIAGMNSLFVEDRASETSTDLVAVVATPVSPYIDWIQNIATKNSSYDFVRRSLDSNSNEESYEE